MKGIKKEWCPECSYTRGLGGELGYEYIQRLFYHFTRLGGRYRRCLACLTVFKWIEGCWEPAGKEERNELQT